MSLVLNVICSGLFVVVSLPFWWQRAQKHSQRARARRLHAVFGALFAVLPVAYGGVYGLAFSETSKWGSFLVYSAFLAVPSVTTVIAFVFPLLGRCRWAVLSLGLAAGFAALAAFLLPSIAEKCLLSEQYHMLIVAHAVNGFLLGLAFARWETLRELLRACWEKLRVWLSARWRRLSRWLWGDDCVRIKAGD